MIGIFIFALLINNVSAHVEKDSNFFTSLKDELVEMESALESIENDLTEKTLVQKDAQLPVIATNGFWGDWGKRAYCPHNHFVYGYQLRSEPPQGRGDDTALNAIGLRCALKGTNIKGKTIYSANGTWGYWSLFKYCTGGNDPVIGFSMKIEPKQWRGDDTAANRLDLYCKKGGYISAPTYTHWGLWTNIQRCPSGHAVVGIQTRVEKFLGRKGDDTALNGVKLFCKPY